MNPKDHKPINERDFKEAIKEVLLKPTPNRTKYQSKNPTNKELNTRFKLEKRE